MNHLRSDKSSRAQHTIVKQPGDTLESDFNTQPERFVANLSVLFDVFPAEEVGARKLQPSAV